MKKTCLVLFFTFTVSSLLAQNVATINAKPIKSEEFLWVYQKNHIGQAKFDYNDLAAYLDLYVNFKLKVAEAKALGLDTVTSYKEEIAGYETALKTQKKVLSNAKEYAYIMNEYREGVLMFNVCEQKIWNKAQSDHEQLKTYFANNANKYEGKNFEEVRGQVVGDYQQQLETDWINTLKSKYKIKINHAELKKLAKQ
ncbi:hypothetical protein [Pedobacter sp.]